MKQWTPNGGIDIRDKRGRFARRGYAISTVIVLGLLCGTLASASFVPVKPEVTFVPTAQAAVVKVTMEQKVEAEKESILDRLAACESAGKKEADGIAILDTNNVGSYGPFQFQRKTVMHYQELKTGEKISGRDAIILALQGDKARELAKWIIFSKAGVENDWTNCSNKLGLQREVDIIKRLTN